MLRAKHGKDNRFSKPSGRSRNAGHLIYASQSKSNDCIFRLIDSGMTRCWCRQKTTKNPPEPRGVSCPKSLLPSPPHISDATEGASLMSSGKRIVGFYTLCELTISSNSSSFVILSSKQWLLRSTYTLRPSTCPNKARPTSHAHLK